MRRRLVSDRAKCTGCMNCQLACSFAHDRRWQLGLSRLWVRKKEELGWSEAVVCRSCEDPRCVRACPNGSLSHDGGGLLLDEEGCLRCGDCIRACCCGALRADPEGLPLVCRLEPGIPPCVAACPTGAIWVEEESEGGPGGCPEARR